MWIVPRERMLQAGCKRCSEFAGGCGASRPTHESVAADSTAKLLEKTLSVNDTATA
jgi:hypothetical protein